MFAVVSLWHPGDGWDVRKKPLPYNYFFTSLFYWFLCGILADNAPCHREAIAVQLACGDLRVLTVRDRSVMFFNITDLITNCGGTVSL